MFVDFKSKCDIETHYPIDHNIKKKNTSEPSKENNNWIYTNTLHTPAKLKKSQSETDLLKVVPIASPFTNSLSPLFPNNR